MRFRCLVSGDGACDWILRCVSDVKSVGLVDESHGMVTVVVSVIPVDVPWPADWRLLGVFPNMLCGFPYGLIIGLDSLSEERVGWWMNDCNLVGSLPLGGAGFGGWWSSSSSVTVGVVRW